MNQVLSSNYSFGDTSLARERLELLADVYEPSSRVFLARLMGFLAAPPTLALDLGCGPGRTTALLREVIEPTFTIGLDASPSFVEHAVTHVAAPGLDFECFLLGSERNSCRAELAYARHLFAHLSEPASAFSSVSELLEEGGLFGLEEVAELSSEDLCFQEYYEFVSEELAQRGHDLRIGSRLAKFASGAFEVLDFRMTELCLSPRRMAELHLRNTEAFLARTNASSEVRRIESFQRAFRRVIAEKRETPPVLCGLGQCIARRRATSVRSPFEGTVP